MDTRWCVSDKAELGRGVDKRWCASEVVGPRKGVDWGVPRQLENGTNASEDVGP